MRKLLLVAAAVIILTTHVQAEDAVKPDVPIWQNCVGTLVKYVDGHYGLVADEADGSYCAFARIPKRLVKKLGCKINYPCQVVGRIQRSFEWIEIERCEGEGCYYRGEDLKKLENIP